MKKMDRPEGEEAKKYWDATEALTYAKSVGVDVTLATFLAWVDKHKLGFQPGGNNSKWFIDRAALTEFLNKKIK